MSDGRRSASRPWSSKIIYSKTPGDIYCCRKPEQIKPHLPVDIQEYKETTVKYGTFGLV